MPTVDVTIEGADALQAALDRWADRVEQATVAGLRAAAEEVQRSVVGQLGRAPAPVNRSGRLAGSFATDEVGPLEVHVGPTAPYARKLEVGDPHPFFGPGFRSARPKIVEAMRKAWGEAQS